MQPNQIFQLGDLFEKVQLEKVFSDGKTFVDCIPQKPLADIRDQYQAASNTAGFDLSTFVRDHFREPAAAGMSYKSNPRKPVGEHVEALWEVLLREPAAPDPGSSLIALSHRYIVPGGRFREIYYWDSYFTMLGLLVSDRVDVVENMLDNFSDLIHQYGYIPNGNRSYFLSRSQPPFFSCMVALLAEKKGQEVLTAYLPAMLKEHQFWMKDAGRVKTEFTAVKRVAMLHKGTYLNRYWDDLDTPRPESYAEDMMLAGQSLSEKKLFRNIRAACESGWDFSSRWLRDPEDLTTIYTTEIIPVDLNCLLFHLEKTISDAAHAAGDTDLADNYFVLANARKDAIDQYCWSKRRQFYFDYDFISGQQSGAETLAAAFPLYFKIASNEKATAIARKLGKSFLKEGGFVTTTQSTGQQWDAPNGWAPLQWIVIRGLWNYGFRDLAQDAAERWLATNEKVFRHTGKMMEKYNVEDTAVEAGGGEYPSQDGFGWTNGVYLKLKEMFG